MEYQNVLFFHERSGRIYYFQDEQLMCCYDSYPEILSSVPYDIKDLMLRAGYRNLANIGESLDTMLGFSEEKILSEVKRRGKQASEKHRKKVESEQRWGKYSPELRAHIIGFKLEYFRVFEDGFSVTVLLKKTGDRSEHKNWIKSHTKEFMSYVCREISEKATIQKKIGSLDYYKPQKVFLRNIDEAEVLFVLKNGIEQAIQTEK